MSPLPTTGQIVYTVTQ